MKKPWETEPQSLTWGKSGDGLAPWPTDENGTPEQGAFLTHMADSGASADMTVSLLTAYGFPVFKSYEQKGMDAKVILGFSGYGVDLYVPRSRLEDAKELLAGQAELENDATEDHEQ